jgi:hypothetical protein
MTLRHGTARCGVFHRVAILDEKGVPVMNVGPQFTDYSTARIHADKMNGLNIPSGVEIRAFAHDANREAQ